MPQCCFLALEWREKCPKQARKKIFLLFSCRIKILSYLCGVVMYTTTPDDFFFLKVISFTYHLFYSLFLFF